MEQRSLSGGSKLLEQTIYIAGLHEVNCSNSTIRGLTAATPYEGVSQINLYYQQ